MIACYVACWNELIPDCPVIMEATSTDILGVCSTPEAAQATIERFKARRREVDTKNSPDDEYYLNGYGSWFYFELDAEQEFYPTGAYPIHAYGTKDVTYHFDEMEEED